MVFFTCNACGESLKKAQIQKHTSICRGCRVLSCIDCGKDFWGEDYKSHVKCISEDQKYGGKNYEAKANKGDVKQQQWIQRVQVALDKPGVSARLSSVLQQVATYNNVPRKKAKFQNWMKNSLKIYDSSLQDQVWDIFSSSDSPSDVQQANEAGQPEHTSSPAPAAQEEQAKPEEKKKNKRERKEERQKKKKRMEDKRNGENGVIEIQKKRKRAAEECGEEGESVEGKASKKMKKRKEEECEETQNIEEAEDKQEAQEESNTKGTFNWKGTIKAVLRQAPEEGIALKKLRKKVLSAYYSFSAEDNHKSEEELHSLFNKKLKNPKFKILKEKVRLVK